MFFFASNRKGVLIVKEISKMVPWPRIMISVALFWANKKPADLNYTPDGPDYDTAAAVAKQG